MTGTATLAFGSIPGTDSTSVDVTGQSGLTTSSHLGAFFQSDSTADNATDAHTFASAVIGLACEFLSSTSFRIHAVSTIGAIAGNFTVHWATA